MTYEPTTLIARKAYGDRGLSGRTEDSQSPRTIRGRTRNYYSLGDASTCSADQEWDADCTYNGIKGQCVPKGTKGSNPACTYPQGTLSQIGSFFSSLLSGAVNSYASAKGTSAQPPPPASSTPSWVMPVAIGGVALVAVVMLTRPRKNPARGRRRSRRRR